MLHLNKTGHIKQLCCFVQLRKVYIAFYFSIKKSTLGSIIVYLRENSLPVVVILTFAVKTVLRLF